MAVEDHPVHPSTVMLARYEACQTAVRKPGYWMKVRRYNPRTGRFRMVDFYVKDRASTKCRYDLYKSDPRCTGCPQEKDIEYLERMGKLK